MKIGIFGGSFNPIHNGHINLAESIKSELNLDRVILMPLGEAPHKSSQEYASATDRYNMCKLVAEDYDWLEVSDFEIKRVGKNYTIYTAEYFREKYKDDELWLLVGSDMLLTFDKWFRYEEILEKMNLAAVSRTGDDFEELTKKAEELSKNSTIRVVKNESVVISSTEIREKIKNNLDFTCYLPKKVVKYIMRCNVYF